VRISLAPILDFFLNCHSPSKMVRGNRAFRGLSNNSKHIFLQTHGTVPLRSSFPFYSCPETTGSGFVFSRFLPMNRSRSVVHKCYEPGLLKRTLSFTAQICTMFYTFLSPKNSIADHLKPGS